MRPFFALFAVSKIHTHLYDQSKILAFLQIQLTKELLKKVLHLGKAEHLIGCTIIFYEPNRSQQFSFNNDFVTEMFDIYLFGNQVIIEWDTFISFLL